MVGEPDGGGRGLEQTWVTGIAELAQICELPATELDVQDIAARLGAIRPGTVVAPLPDVRGIEKTIGRLLSLGWRGPAGGRTVHRLLYDLARWADHDDATAERLLRHALEFLASRRQTRLTRERLGRVRDCPRT